MTKRSLITWLKTALRRPVTLTVLCLAVCLAGLFAVQGCSGGGSGQGGAAQEDAGEGGAASAIQEGIEQELRTAETAPEPETTVPIGGDDSLFQDPEAPDGSITMDTIPPFDGDLYVEIDNNIPSFSENEITDVSFESYAELDRLGRCGTAFACLSRDTMPARGEQRGEIYMIYPSGWEQNFYEFVDREALYNRSHLIAWKLSAENANERNLITGTRTMNSEGMTPFEDMVWEYIRDTGNHVMYRVTPVFEGNNLVASGVHMEAYSVEDRGAGIAFNVYCYNVEPGVWIDYATGENRESRAR